MRKQLAAAAVTACIAAGGLVASAPGARADQSSCGQWSVTLYSCWVGQGTAQGSGQARVYFDGSTGLAAGSFSNTSGFSMRSSLQIDYGTGYVTVWSSDNFIGLSPWFDDSGYLARACFQFTSWSGAALHCTAGV